MGRTGDGSRRVVIRRELTLPSGMRARLSAPRGLRLAHDEEVLFGELVQALEDGRVQLERREGRAWCALGPDAIEALLLPDFHALRDLATRMRLVPAEVERFECTNCDAPLTLDPAALDPEDLEERFEGAPPPPSQRFELPHPVRLPRGGRALDVAMRPVTVAEARHLWRVLAHGDAFDVTPKLLASMGVTALGPLEKPWLVARILRRADDETWCAVEHGFLALAYSPHALTPLECPACGALEPLQIPWPRELDPDAALARDERGVEAPFPDAADFERDVARIAAELFEARAIEDVALRVEPGVAATDVGGTTLMGSYDPPAVDVEGAEATITIYYRTFARLWDEGPYDVEGEIRDTIEHELEHHAYHLAGEDPLDEEERAEAERELVALHGGARRVRRVIVRQGAAQVASMLRSAWPFLLVIALVLGGAMAEHLGWIDAVIGGR